MLSYIADYKYIGKLLLYYFHISAGRITKQRRLNAGKRTAEIILPNAEAIIGHISRLSIGPSKHIIDIRLGQVVIVRIIV